jgi:carboxymethylenebutenolidase
MDRIDVMELVRAFQVGGMSRRDFVARATVAVGAAEAAQLLLTAERFARADLPPVVAEAAAATSTPAPTTIVTPADGLQIGQAQYPDVDGKPLTGYLGYPVGASRSPAVIVIQEWWGVDEHIQDVVRRFGQQGYAALAPDLYHGVVVTEPDEARKMVMQLDMAAAVREIRQAVAFLKQQAYAGSKIGIVGFCMGGGLVLQTARQESALSAAIAFYGSPLNDATAAEVKAPLLGLYGSQDQSIPVERVKAMDAALTKAGIEHEIHIYNAPHAFFNDTRPSGYNREAAVDAWAHVLEWFRRHLT